MDLLRTLLLVTSIGFLNQCTSFRTSARAFGEINHSTGRIGNPSFIRMELPPNKYQDMQPRIKEQEQREKILNFVIRMG